MMEIDENHSSINAMLLSQTLLKLKFITKLCFDHRKHIDVTSKSCLEKTKDIVSDLSRRGQCEAPHAHTDPQTPG